MPRPLQRIVPGTTYHLISRFVAREWFIQGDTERRQYMELFGRAIAGSDWTSLAFAVMSSHLHHAVIAGRDPLKSWLGEAHGPYAEWINRRHDRIGAVFVRGPKAIPVRSDGLARLVGYIHRNPVRARVVGRAAETDWTSHRAYVGPDSAPAWLDVRRGLDLMGFADGAEFDRWVDATPITRAQLEDIRLEPVRRGRPPIDARWETKAVAQMYAERGLLDGSIVSP